MVYGIGMEGFDNINEGMRYGMINIRKFRALGKNDRPSTFCMLQERHSLKKLFNLFCKILAREKTVRSPITLSFLDIFGKNCLRCVSSAHG